MALDINNREIGRGDIVRCVTNTYYDMLCGYETVVDDVSSTAIYLREFDYQYNTPARYNSYNFKRLECFTGRPSSKQLKGTNQMLHCAVRIDGIDTTNELIELLNKGNNSCLPHYESNFPLLQKFVENDIKMFSAHQWLMLSPVSIGELAGPPVRFRSVK